MVEHKMRFLKCAAQAGLLCAAEKGAQWLHIDFFYNWVAKTWEFYSLESREVRLADLEQITPMKPQEIRSEIAQIVAESAAGASVEVQDRVVELVCQIPPKLRRSIRVSKNLRQSTMPTELKLETPQDCMNLLPDKLAMSHRWCLSSMRPKLVELGAGRLEINAFEAIFDCGEEIGSCVFQASKKPSFVIQIPTVGESVSLLTVQGRGLKFYFGHFVGGYDVSGRANLACKKFSHAYPLAERYCQLLNEAFGWKLNVLNGKGGFSEPLLPISDVADPRDLNFLINILQRVAVEANCEYKE
ncbi:hypothetical protein NA78x_004447 [Anatilimnocola sp. NA78]|uniref:hypothetical protein n=1 Tax=Anatilimnocola sp. NA78 TaxID=3415683 RepID=UPI003CE58D25